jgi:hypothetical protein
MFRSRVDGRRFLILLDNAADEKQVEPLLPASSTCAVLITSRSPLTALAGTKYLKLGVMGKADALQLFAQLAPHELINAASAETEAIVARCGYLPLAIRIAGAKVAESGDLIGFGRELEEERTRLSTLKHGDLDVRASLELSYHGLSPSAQRAFRLLAH